MSTLSGLISGGGGGGGAAINEYRFFVDRGDTFTDDDGQVWLKKGARSLDNSTYPDAYAPGAAVSKSADFKSANAFAAGNYADPEGLCVDEDSAWVIGRQSRSSSYAYRYTYQHISSDTVYDQTPPNYYTQDIFVAGLYAKCTNATNSQITGANDNIGALLSWYNNQQIALYSYNLEGGSGNDQGKLNGKQDYMYLNNSSGTALRTTGIFNYDHTSTFGMAWDKTSRKLYVLGQCTHAGTYKLYVYHLSGQTFGYSGFALPNSMSASQEIDLGTGYTFYALSSDSTHLYIVYNNGSENKIRKIAKSGNLAFSGGTDLAGTASDPGSGAGLLWQNADGTFTTRTRKQEAIVYYRTVSSVPKFLVTSYPGSSYTTHTLSEFAINVPAIGEAEPDADAAKTQYQRIK